MGIDIRRMVVQAVALPLVLIGIVAAWLAWQVVRLRGAVELVDHADAVITQASEVQKQMLEQETGLRAFLLTEERSFLAPYSRAHPEAAIERLTGLVAGDEEQLARAVELRDRYLAWQAHADRAIRDPASARSVSSIRECKAAMDTIRADITAVAGAAQEAHARRAEQVQTETQLTAVGSALILVVLGGALSLVSRQRLQLLARTYDGALTRSAQSEAALAELVEREREAREKAETTLRAKDEFLTMLSHELRTPLTSILGWASVMRARPHTADTLERALGAIERNARAQAQIIDDLLDEARMMTGKFQLRLVPMDLGASVRAAVEVVRFSAETKGVAIHPDIASRPIRMVGDPDRLQQVVWNLLSNAVKFTPRGGRIEVTADLEDDEARVSVRDSGEGISAEFLPHVFERFRQADSSMKRAHGGLGLGLAIVKHLVDLHGGEVRVESEGPGRGAMFTVSLPLAEVRAPAPETERPADGAALGR